MRTRELPQIMKTGIQILGPMEQRGVPANASDSSSEGAIAFLIPHTSLLSHKSCCSHCVVNVFYLGISVELFWPSDFRAVKGKQVTSLWRGVSILCRRITVVFANMHAFPQDDTLPIFLGSELLFLSYSSKPHSNPNPNPNVFVLCFNNKLMFLVFL